MLVIEKKEVPVKDRRKVRDFIIIRNEDFL